GSRAAPSCGSQRRITTLRAKKAISASAGGQGDSTLVGSGAVTLAAVVTFVIVARSARAGQCAASFEPFLGIGHVAGLVVPRVAPEPRLVDEDRAPRGDVVEAAKREADPECSHRLAVEVREQPEVQVERLRPRDVAPRRVARDAD